MSADYSTTPVVPLSWQRRYTRLAVIVGCGTLAAFCLGAGSVALQSGASHTLSLSTPPEHQAYRREFPAMDYRAQRVQHETLAAGIQTAADYLVQVTGDDGQCIYRTYLDGSEPDTSCYNVLRHAGSMYALADFHTDRPSPLVAETLQRQAGFLKRECIRPVGESDEMLAVWSRPEITGLDGPLTAKLGGTGLGLIALVSVERVAPGTTSKADLQSLGSFLVFMQKEDGGFYSKYTPSAGGRDDSWTSLYYPGEAALGLVMLYELDPNPQWIESAARALTFLAASREGEEEVEADHWALLATARLLTHRGKFENVVPQPVLQTHADQICRSMLADKPEHAGDSPRWGCFGFDGRTCPTSTRLEGLQAMLSAGMHPEPPLAYDLVSTIPQAELETASEQGIGFLLRAQQTSGPLAGAIPRALQPLDDSPENFDFNRRADEVRIDYVQHALSAMLAYERRNFTVTLEPASPGGQE